MQARLFTIYQGPGIPWMYSYQFPHSQLSRFTERGHLVTVRVQVMEKYETSVEWEELVVLPRLVTSQ